MAETSEFFQLHPTKYSTKCLLQQSTRPCIKFRHGHIAICNYHLGDNPEFEKTISVFDEMKWKYKMKGGYYIPELHELRINRAFNPEQLAKYFKGYDVRVENDAYPADKVDINLLVPPRDDLQRVGITFICGQGEFRRNLDYTQQMIDAPVGEGKAQPDDTIIPTPKGPKRLDELVVGDEVYNLNGTPVKVLDIYPQYGLDDTIEITFKDGRKARCNLEHLWTVSINGYHKYITLPITKIIFAVETSKRYTFTVPKPGYVEGNPYNDAADDALQIMSFRKVEQTSQRCILVDDPQHIYLTEDYIPTHNTYLGASASCFMSARTLIIVPLSVLVDQWKETYLKFTSVKEDEILVVKGSDTCRKIADGKYPDTKIFIMLADTLTSFQKRYGDLETIDMLRSMNVYLKIIDEIHKEMKIVSMIEALSNFRMNLYMSATPGRAQRKENWIFKTCFWNIPHFGSKFKLQEEKHINVLVKAYRFIPTPAQINRMVNKRKGWLNPKAYEKELLNAPNSQSEDFVTSLTNMLEWAKTLLKPENKILLLCETIDGTACMQGIAETVFPKKTSRYYGTMNKADKEDGLKGRVICATATSLGTGADIHGIQFVFNITTYANTIAASQLPGRARPLADGTPVWYCEFVNMAYMKTVKQYEKRKPSLIKTARLGKIMLIS